jgi:hypothetical protein
LNPSIKWSEEWLQKQQYRVTARVQLDGFDHITIEKMGGEPVTRISSNGKHVIAGPDTEYGPAGLGTMFVAKVPNSLKMEGTLKSHGVGGDEEPPSYIHLMGLHGNTMPNPDQGGRIKKTFVTETDRGTLTMPIRIPKLLLKYYKNRPRIPDYGAYVSGRYDDPCLKQIADKFEKVGERNGLSDRRVVNLAMKFVQNLEYSKDKVSTGFNEYPKFPVETLADKGGDCEDTCILLSSLFNQMGYDTKLLLFREEQHMALGLAGEEGVRGTYYKQDGTRYYYVETTNPGWEVGDVPPNLRNADTRLVPVNSHPMLVYSYAIDAPTVSKLKIKMKALNVGDAPTKNAQLLVQFQDTEKRTVAKKRTKSLQIAPREEVNTSITMRPPDDQKLRAKVLALLDNQLHDSVTSEYREPTKMGTTTPSG